MKLNCALTLRPLDWSQRVQHLLDFEGRRLSASCEVVSSDLELSGGLSVEKLPAKLQICEKTQKDLSIFPKYTLGWLRATIRHKILNTHHSFQGSSL
jgi:hypothetical protein